MNKGETIHGFLCEQVEPLEDLRATLMRLRHTKTGAEMIHLANEDENNLFSVAFRTTPMDSTGVAHILEHTALCGSEKFPVRDPFFSMLKRSLNTFMNALTANDWTMYPFSTMNEKDFYNLLDIYLDASFFPNIRELSFKQEGWRLEFEDMADSDSPLLFKGVVYNEMKGAMSDPNSLMHRRMQMALYPSTTYHYNSGGEPADIPDLTWENLKAFHARYYHPSNAKFFSYGNFPLEKHLSVIDERVLSRFEQIDVNSAVGEEPRYDSPRMQEFGYPVEADTPKEELRKKGFVSLSWLACPATDPFEVFSLNILSSLFLGSPAAPLYKALLDSKLGSQLAPGTGYDDENRETCFAAGLQGADVDDAEKIEVIILDTLGKLAEEGFPEERVEAVIHQIEFGNKEVVGNYYPYGLNLLFRLFGSWVHDADPVAPLLIDKQVERLRRELKSGSFFQDKIRRYFLDNSHRVRVVLKPDPDMGTKEAEKEADRLREIRSKLSKEDVEKILSDSKALEKEQESDEDIECLPTLELTDIPATSPRVEYEKKFLDGLETYWFDQPTNGISYFSALVKVDAVPLELKPYVPLFCSLLTKIGAGGLDYIKMAERIEAHTGGIGVGASVWESLDSLDRYDEIVEFSGKALVRNQGELFNILGDIFNSPDFGDLSRLHTLIGQIKTSMENSVPGAGHSYARGLGARHLTAAAMQRESWFGVGYLHLLRELASLKENELDGLADKMESLAGILLNRSTMKLSVVTEARYFDSMEEPMALFLKSLDEKEDSVRPPLEFNPGTSMEGWSTNVPVSYVASVFRTVPYSHPDSTALLVLSKLLRACYLHREVREKGGAYGGYASYSSSEGLFSFLSYRDPHLERTLKVYDEAVDWVLKGDFSDENLKEAILSTFSEIDKPLSPAGKGDREFTAILRGLTFEVRQKRREAILALDKKSLINVAGKYLKDGESSKAVAVVSNSQRLEEANNHLKNKGLEIHVL